MAAVRPPFQDPRLVLDRLRLRRPTVPRQYQIASILATVLLLASLTTLDARIRFELRVANTRATLLVDGQTIGVAWPAGITHAAPLSSPADERLFAVDGTDRAGTLSEDSSSLAAAMGNSYFRFVCWLRDCGGYSQWQDFSLRDDVTGQVLLRTGGSAALSRLVLPARFTLHGVLQRPDVAAAIAFSGAAETQLIIDPNGRSIRLNGHGQYYPYDWRPYLAEVGWTLTRACLWAFVLLAGILVASIAQARLRLPALPTLHRAASRAPRLLPVVPYAAAGALFAVLLAISAITYQRLPRVFDGVSYYFQAAILRSGHLAMDTPRAAAYFPGPFMVNMNGHWFSHFPPGAPLAIALGMLVNLPWVVEPLLGALSALLIADLAHRWYGWSTAWLALVLLGLSPFYLFLASSYLSHMVALFALLLFLEGIDRLATTGDWRWAMLAGTGAGYAFLTREIAMALFVLPVGVYYGARELPALWLRVRRDGVSWLEAADTFVWLVTPLLVCAAFYLYYDWRLTGQVLLTPRAAFDPRDTWGFGAGKGWYDQHTPAAGLFVVENLLTSLLTHLFGWPYYLTLSFFLVPLLTLRLRAYDLLLYGIAASFLLGYIGYFYHGIAFGPRYLFESLPAYVLLSARGVVEAATIGCMLLRRVVGHPAARAGGMIGAGLALFVLCACDIGFYLPRQFPLYYDYLEHRAKGGLAYERLHPSWMHRAIVLTDDYGFYGDVLFPLNDPGLQGDVLYAFMGGGLDLKGLQKLYPHRTLYWISTANNQIDFRPVDAGRPVAQQIALPLPAAQRRLVQESHLVREGMHGSANHT